MITILCNHSGLAYSIINASPERLAEMRSRVVRSSCRTIPTSRVTSRSGLVTCMTGTANSLLRRRRASIGRRRTQRSRSSR